MNENNNQIVQTNQIYNYNLLQQNIQELKITHPFLEIGSIGNSVLGKQIPYIKIGGGKNQVLYHGAIHANRWIYQLPYIIKKIRGQLIYSSVKMSISVAVYYEQK